MGATAAAIVTTRPGRVRYDHYETLSASAGACTMCGAPIEPNVPHACAKPDLDHPPHVVRARCEPMESATFPIFIHKGLAWRLDGRVYRCTNESNFIESRAVFDVLVEAAVLEEVRCEA